MNSIKFLFVLFSINNNTKLDYKKYWLTETVKQDNTFTVFIVSSIL